MPFLSPRKILYTLSLKPTKDCWCLVLSFEGKLRIKTIREVEKELFHCEESLTLLENAIERLNCDLLEKETEREILIFLQRQYARLELLKGDLNDSAFVFELPEKTLTQYLHQLCRFRLECQEIILNFSSHFDS